MEDFHNELKRHISSFHTLPYLFIGSGVSRRYLGIPTWADLLRQFHPKLGLEFPFDYYLSLSGSNLPQLASDFAKAFHAIWWGQAQYEEDRREFSALAGTGIEIPFKIELSKLVAQYKSENVSYGDEIGELKKASVSGAITTNWDSFLSDSFPDFRTFIGQQELLFADNLHIGDIYKIHGSTSKPESLVVTAADYALFNSRNVYLASKLLTIFVEHPVIFLGYSLTDENVRAIITSIVECLDKTNIGKFRDRLIFVDWTSGATIPTMADSVFLAGHSTLPIKLIQTSSFMPIFSVLADLQQKIPFKILRKLKSVVYDLVATDKPTKVMYVGELSEIEGHDDIEFVVGVGLAKPGLLASGRELQQFGYHSPDTKDIIKDLLFDDAHYDAKILIRETLPRILRQTTYCPYFKYFRQACYLNNDGSLNDNGKSAIKGLITWRTNVPASFAPPSSFKKKTREIKDKYGTLAAAIVGETTLNLLMAIPSLDSTAYTVDEDKDFLISYYNGSTPASNYTTTYFRKAVCFLDYLLYAKVP